jgi:hypothetical protein
MAQANLEGIQHGFLFTLALRYFTVDLWPSMLPEVVAHLWLSTADLEILVAALTLEIIDKHALDFAIDRSTPRTTDKERQTPQTWRCRHRDGALRSAEPHMTTQDVHTTHAHTSGYA